jgi:Holliday junction resolvase RusA-like endonuclease
MYEASADTKYKETILHLMQQSDALQEAAKKIRHSSGPFHATMVYHMPPPKNREVKVRIAKENDALFLCDRKPDLDNLEKAVMDAAEGFLFDNDARIASKYATKVYAQEDGEPRIDVHIKRVSYWLPYNFLQKVVRIFQWFTRGIQAVNGHGNPLQGEISDAEVERIQAEVEASSSSEGSPSESSKASGKENSPDAGLKRVA